MSAALPPAAAGGPIRFAELAIPVGIPIGDFTLHFYSLAYVAGILLGYWHLRRMARAPGSPITLDHCESLFLYCTIGIFVGARVGQALFYDPGMFIRWTPGETIAWDFLRVWEGGLSFHGGALGVILAVAWVAWREKLSFIRTGDYIAVNIPFGVMFGRLGNFVNGELWGRPAEGVPWAMVFPGAGEIARHPSQLYEAASEGALMIAVLLLLFWKTRARYFPAYLTGVFVLGSAAARFVCEFFREPDAPPAAWIAHSGLSIGQWLSLGFALYGLASIAWGLRYRARESAPAR